MTQHTDLSRGGKQQEESSNALLLLFVCLFSCMARVLVVAKLSAAAAAESFATTKTLAISPSMRYTTKHANPKFDTAGERNNKRNAAGREGRGEEPGRGQAIAPTMATLNWPVKRVHSLPITQKV